jgi:hypothetical protein
MFFAETLGPILTPGIAQDLRAFLQRKLDGRTDVSPEQLREIVSEYLYGADLRANTDAVIDFLARSRVLAFQGPTAGAGARFEVAA